MSPCLASNFALSLAREADLHFSMILGTASAFRQVGELDCSKRLSLSLHSHASPPHLRHLERRCRFSWP